MHCNYSNLSCAFETKAEGNDTATFTGIATTCDADSQNDVIEVGAFDPIARKSNNHPDVMMLRDHDRSQVIGGWTDFVQHGHQLLVEGELCLEVPKARETYALMKKGYLSGLSVGFNPIKDGVEIDKRNNRRYIKKAILRECSIVAFPANSGARVLNIKNEDFVERLASYGLTLEDAEILVSEGLDALIERRIKPAPPPVPKSELIKSIQSIEIVEHTDPVLVMEASRALLQKLKGLGHG